MPAIAPPICRSSSQAYPYRRFLVAGEYQGWNRIDVFGSQTFYNICKTDLTVRKAFGVRCDMLPIPLNYTISRTARHQIGTRFEHGIDLLTHHQMQLIQSATATASELEHPKPDHVTGFKASIMAE
jgi:hypothetical protein